MAISCPRCRRQYDVTLFQFGRTINCACGERVGFEHKINLSRDGGNNEEIKFFADVMTARVVRWLRAIGIDTVWEDAIADRDLVRRAIDEKRFILTLDKPLVDEWRVDNVLLLQSEKPLEQFEAIIRHFGIEKPKALFTRCLVCNTPLRRAVAEEITGAVSEDVRKHQEKFDFCRHCSKVYWQGSHTERMRLAINEIFERQK